MPLGQSAVSIGIDEVGLHLRMTLQHLACTVEAQHHEGGSVGIGHGTAGRQNGGREQFVLNRIACARVDGVGIFASALVVEVAVIAAGGHGSIADSEDGLQAVAFLRLDIFRGLAHANLPLLLLPLLPLLIPVSPSSTQT